MLNILSRVPLGQLMRDLHRLGAEAMVIVVTLHMLRTFFTGSYKKPRQFTWFTGVILLLATLFLSFSGYLLPWDQLALWAVTIGASMVEAAPPKVVGTNLNLLLRGGPDIGANGLLRFYLLHVIAVPAILLIFTGVHYYKVIVHGHSLPPKSENMGEDTAKRVPLDKRAYFIPDVLTRELMWIGVTTFILVVMAVWFFHAPLENHADPQNTPLGTTAPWYFLWIQGALKLGDKVIWGIVFPTVVFVSLMALPYIDTSISRRFADRRFMMSLAFMGVSAVIVFSYMGTAEYGVDPSANERVLHEMTHEPAHNKMGLLLPVSFDGFVPGIYTTRQFGNEEGLEAEAIRLLEAELVGTALGGQLADALRLDHNEMIDEQASNLQFSLLPTDSTELVHVVETFYEEIEAEPEDLLGGWGAVIITENQPDLVRIDVIVVWQALEMEMEVDKETGEEKETTSPRRDEDDNVIPKVDEEGTPVYRVHTNHAFVHRESSYFMD